MPSSLTVTTSTVASHGTGHPQPAAGKVLWPDKGIFRGISHGRWMIMSCEFETLIMACHNPHITGWYNPLNTANHQVLDHNTVILHMIFFEISAGSA